MKQFDIPGIAKGTVVPNIVKEKEYKEKQEKINDKKYKRYQFWHDVLIAIIGIVLGNADRIFEFISALLKTLLSE